MKTIKTDDTDENWATRANPRGFLIFLLLLAVIGGGASQVRGALPPGPILRLAVPTDHWELRPWFRSK